MPTTSPTIPEHDAAALLPPMSDAEFSALVEDIRANGLREPIVLHEGKILDGRHRMRACEQLGIEPQIKQWDGKGSPEAFVTSMNLHRRHLTVGQRAMIAAKMATLSSGQHKGLDADGIPSADDAGRLMGVKREQVQNAKVVIARGTQEEIAAVNAGRASVETLSRDIKAGLTPKERAEKRSPRGAEAAIKSRLQTQQMNAQIYGQLRDGIGALSTLPRAADVVRTVKNTSQHERKVTTEIIQRALVWLSEFSNEWNRQGTASNSEAEGAGDHHPDPRSGNESAGAEWPKSAA